MDIQRTLLRFLGPLEEFIKLQRRSCIASIVVSKQRYFRLSFRSIIQFHQFDIGRCDDKHGISCFGQIHNTVDHEKRHGKDDVLCSFGTGIGDVVIISGRAADDVFGHEAEAEDHGYGTVEEVVHVGRGWGGFGAVEEAVEFVCEVRA